MKRICMVLVTLILTAGSVVAQGLTQDVLYFDGKATYVELPVGAFDMVSDGTVEAWVKWEKFNKWARVFDFGVEKNAMVIQTEKTSSTVNFVVWDQKGKRHRTQAKKAVRKGTWHHVAVVFGRSGTVFYLDGRRVDTDKYEGGLEEVRGGNYYIESPLKTPIFKKIGQLGEISINKNNNLQR